MRILLLNQYFPPDTSATAKMAAQVAAALATRHEVTVLAGRPSYDPSQRHPRYLHRTERHGAIAVHRVGSSTYSRHRMAQRLSNYLSYLSLALPSAMLVHPDVVLAMTDPPVAGIAAAFLARALRRPFIYNIRDLYPDMVLGAGIVRPSRWVERWEKLHRHALRQAQRIIVLGEDMRERIIAKGLDPSRVRIVRDGAPIPAQLASPQHPVVKEIRCGFPFVAIHAGNLGFYGAWSTLVKAARFVERDGVGLIFVGEGAARRKVEEEARGCAAVRFLPFRPPEEVPYVLAAGDVHIITVQKELTGVVVPSKLYPILAAGRPVLAVASKESDVARIVTRSGCGLVASPDDPGEVAAALRMLAHDRARLAGMGQRARQVAHEYEQQKQFDLFVQTVEEACESRSAAIPGYAVQPGERAVPESFLPEQAGASPSPPARAAVALGRTTVSACAGESNDQRVR